MASQFAVNLYYFVKIYRSKIVTQENPFLIILRVLYVVTTFTDLFLATVFIILVRKLRDGQKRSEAVVSRLVLYTISSSAITALNAIAALVSAIFLSETHTHLVFASFIPLCE